MDFSDKDNNNSELMQIFQGESEEIIDRIFSNLFSLEKTPANKELIANLYRDLHSLKGAVRMIGYNNIQMIIHKMEDIVDAVNNSKLKMEPRFVNLLSHSLEIVAKYIQESIKNNREIIDDNYKSTVSNLEYILDVEMTEAETPAPSAGNGGIPGLDIPGLDIPGIDISEFNIPSFNSQSIDVSNYTTETKPDLSKHQEEINTGFNSCFEIIDGIVPEEETQEIVILKEEVQKIYDFFKDTDMYEVKSSLENVITKIDFVMNGTNTLTVSEILELRNELSSAVAKFTTSCIQTDSKGFSFFDVAEKMSMLQGSSVYTNEIKEDILQLKEDVDDASILEILNVILEILDFIVENSVQLEEQMVQTLKSGIEYCASPNENIDSDLIVQQLEIMKQLLI